jgi:ribosomal protein S12 methylthiotransferase
LPDQVPDDVKQDRFERIMAVSARISAEKLAAKVGSTIDVLIDRVDDTADPADGADKGHFDAPHPAHHHDVGATGRSKADAPEIDGEVHLRDAGGLKPGDIVSVRIEDSDEHDLYGVPA